MADGMVPVEECAAWLIRIARDLRAAGDVPLVRLGTEGVTDEALTLAGELELIALQLDFEGVTSRARQGPDDPPGAAS